MLYLTFTTSFWFFFIRHQMFGDFLMTLCIFYLENDRESYWHKSKFKFSHYSMSIRFWMFLRKLMNLLVKLFELFIQFDWTTICSMRYIGIIEKSKKKSLRTWNFKGRRDFYGSFRRLSILILELVVRKIFSRISRMGTGIIKGKVDPIWLGHSSPVDNSYRRRANA